MKKKKAELSKAPGAVRSRRYRAKLKKKKKLAAAQWKLDKKLSKLANDVAERNSEPSATIRIEGSTVLGTAGVDEVPAVMPNEAAATL